jgi:hypothetical protein
VVKGVNDPEGGYWVGPWMKWRPAKIKNIVFLKQKHKQKKKKTQTRIVVILK